jgi:Zn-dependent protease
LYTENSLKISIIIEQFCFTDRTELRHTVHRDFDEISLDHEDKNHHRANEIDYDHPEYYLQQEPGVRPAQLNQIEDNPYDPSSLATSYTEASPVSSAPSYDIEQMGEYRGPKSMEGYTMDVGSEQREAAQRGSMESGGKKKGIAGIGAALAALGALVLKLPWLLGLLKFGWLGFSAFLSIAVYALIFGWSFAIGLVVMLFIHEMGHALVMKIKGIPIGAVTFIPFLGAAVTMRRMPQNAQDEAEVGIAGPIAGAMAAGVCLLIAELAPHPMNIWAPLAYFGFFLNLFNLIPIVPFDGGRVLAAIDRRIWLLGFIGLLAFQIWQWFQGNFSPWLLIFVVMAATQLWSRGFSPMTPEEKAYYNVPIGTRISLSLLYFGLIAVLVLGMSIAHSMMPIAR